MSCSHAQVELRFRMGPRDFVAQIQCAACGDPRSVPVPASKIPPRFPRVPWVDAPRPVQLEVFG